MALPNSFATQARSTSPMAAIANFPTIIKLDEDNFKAWNRQALACIKANRLQNHISACSMPKKYNSVEDQEAEQVSPEFEEWEQRDECLVAWMLSTMDEFFVNKIVEHQYAHEIWEVLEEHFAARIKSKIKLLKAQLKSIKKHDSSAAEFVTKINKVANSLSTLRAPLTKEEYFECTLGGLDEEFSAFITMVNGRSDHMSINELESQLLAQEEVNERFRKANLNMVHANLVQWKLDSSKEAMEYQTEAPYESYPRDYGRGQSGRRGRGRNSFRSGRSWWQNNRPQCQLCGRTGHTVWQCYHRFNLDYQNPQLQHPNTGPPPPNDGFHQQNQLVQPYYQPNQPTQPYYQPQSPHAQPYSQPPQQPLQINQNSQALLTTLGTSSDPGWYPDSGTSHHITFDQLNLINSSEYQPEQVFGGNGKGMSIANIGRSIIHASMSNKIFKLQNLLHVPTISKNLISVSKFALDNGVFFEFWPYLCAVKCQECKKVLLQGRLRNGLYRFDDIQVQRPSCKVEKEKAANDEKSICANVSVKLIPSEKKGKHVVCCHESKEKKNEEKQKTSCSKPIESANSATSSSVQSSVNKNVHEDSNVNANFDSVQSSVNKNLYKDSNTNTNTNFDTISSQFNTNIFSNTLNCTAAFLNRCASDSNTTMNNDCYGKPPTDAALNSCAITTNSRYSSDHKGYKCLSSSGRVYISRNVIFWEHEFPYQTLFKTPPPKPTNPVLSPPSNFTFRQIPQPQSSPSPSSSPTYIDIHDIPSTNINAVSNSLPDAFIAVTENNAATDSVTTIDSSNSLLQAAIESMPPAPAAQNTHAMVTRSKNGIFKPRVFTTTLASATEECAYQNLPKSIEQALSTPYWREAMEEEFSALQNNLTWRLVDPPAHSAPIGCKWVFRVKKNPDGSIQKYKARLVEKGFH
ncbi:uncharacterized protein [Arachis hypogaea]|uniref:uncharacterized protein n=1 Tax=Arachis hypogaea TaxID=3818 RepID=UPI003B223800